MNRKLAALGLMLITLLALSCQSNSFSLEEDETCNYRYSRVGEFVIEFRQCERGRPEIAAYHEGRKVSQETTNHHFQSVFVFKDTIRLVSSFDKLLPSQVGKIIHLPILNDSIPIMYHVRRSKGSIKLEDKSLESVVFAEDNSVIINDSSEPILLENLILRSSGITEAWFKTGDSVTYFQYYSAPSEEFARGLRRKFRGLNNQ